MDTPRLLVLRIWCAPGRFRAVVRELDHERTHVFQQPRALLRFLTAPRAIHGPDRANPP